MEIEELITRPYNSITDQAFVIDSWQRSFFNGSPFTTYLTVEEFHVKHIPIIQKLIDRSNIILMVEASTPDLILGYVVYEAWALHYVYVKEAFRGFGIAKKLLSLCEFVDKPRMTHITDRSRRMLRDRGFIYSPYF